MEPTKVSTNEFDDTEKTFEHDFSDVDTAEEAFEKLSAIVEKMAEGNGHNPDRETISWDEEQTAQKRDVEGEVYAVGYEAGPNDWAVRMVGGETITVYNLEDDEFQKHKLVNFWDDNRNSWNVECQYSFELHIYGGR